MSNYIACKGAWVGKFEDDVYNEWKRKKQSLTYNFINEMTPYADRFEELFAWEDTHPLLLREYMGKEYQWKHWSSWITNQLSEELER